MSECRPLFYGLRILILYVMLGVTAALWCLAGFIVTPFGSYRLRNWVIAYSWCRNAVRMTRWLVNIDYRVTGWENVPKQPCVILSNHQSAWETFYLTGSFEPLTQVLKRELLYLPFFGWAIGLLKPIAIDRKNPKEALRQVTREGQERLRKGVWVLIFPEGTRTPVGQPQKFSRSGSSIAAKAGLPVLPVAHNAGVFWPRDGWGKRPGTIDVVIGEPMYAADDSPRAIAELNQRAEDWVLSTVRELEARAQH